MKNNGILLNEKSSKNGTTCENVISSVTLFQYTKMLSILCNVYAQKRQVQIKKKTETDINVVN